VEKGYISLFDEQRPESQQKCDGANYAEIREGRCIFDLHEHGANYSLRIKYAQPLKRRLLD
jgi:hypothetical protein